MGGSVSTLTAEVLPRRRTRHREAQRAAVRPSPARSQRTAHRPGHLHPEVLGGTVGTLKGAGGLGSLRAQCVGLVRPYPGPGVGRLCKKRIHKSKYVY